MVDATFRKPLAWSAARGRYEQWLADRLPLDAPWHGDIPPLWVFCLSLGDFFDNAVDPQWRADAWAIIRQCRHLRFQIVTKRVGNVASMLPHDWHMRDRDGEHYYRHVGIISTVTSEAEFLRDGPKLKALKDKGVRWVGLSVEPMLAPLRLGRDDDWLDWVIIGGESSQGGKRARQFDLGAAALLLGDCQQAGVPCFVKQMGSNPVDVYAAEGIARVYNFVDRAGANIAEWPVHLQCREMPKVYAAA